MGEWSDDFTDWGGEGLPGELPTDVDSGAGQGGSLSDYFSGWLDQAGNITEAYRDVAGGLATGGIGGALSAGMDYVTGKKKGKIPGGKPALRVVPPLDTSIAIQEPGMGEAIDYGQGTDAIVPDRTNAAHPGDPWTLPQLTANSGITTKKVCWAIKRFGGPIVPWIVRFLQTDTSTFMSAYLASSCIVGRRRGRGISYRQLNNARRVNRTISKMYHQLHRGHGFR